MDRTPCHHTLATRQNQRQIDAAAARGDAHALLQQELQVFFLGAMQGLTNKVPGYVIRQGSMAYAETERPFVDELADALEHAEAFEQLLMTLRDSACPMVAELRRRLAAVYVRTTVDGVEMARGVA